MHSVTVHDFGWCWWRLARCRNAAGAWQVVVPQSGRPWHQLTNKPRGKQTMLWHVMTCYDMLWHVMTIYDPCKPRWNQGDTNLNQLNQLKKFLKFWFRPSRQVAATLEHKDGICDLTWAPSGRLTAASADGTVSLWEATAAMAMGHCELWFWVHSASDRKCFVNHIVILCHLRTAWGKFLKINKT